MWQMHLRWPAWDFGQTEDEWQWRQLSSGLVLSRLFGWFALMTSQPGSAAPHWAFHVHPSWYSVSAWIRPHLCQSWTDTTPQSAHRITTPSEHHSRCTRANGTGDPAASKIKSPHIFVLCSEAHLLLKNNWWGALVWDVTAYISCHFAVQSYVDPMLCLQFPVLSAGGVKQHKTLFKASYYRAFLIFFFRWRDGEARWICADVKLHTTITLMIKSASR